MRITQSSFIAGVALALSLMLVGSASGQSTITGRVIDSVGGQPIPGVEVSAGGQTVQTDAQGMFRLSVPPGRHSVVVSTGGFGYEPSVAAVNLAAGETQTLEIGLTPRAFRLGGVVTTIVPNVTQDLVRAPAMVGSVQRREIEGRPVTTPAEYVKDLPGVDFVANGISQRTVVTRGFNNVFSGALLVLQDYRVARVPSLRFNAYNMIPATNLDIDRVEMVLGPASALYGPNSANGIMHIITASPIDRPGTSVSIAGGNRDIFNGAFRQSFNFNDRAGLKVSGNYFRGNDFEFNDPAEVPDPGNPLIGARDFDSEKWGGEARFDLRPWEGSDDGLTLTYGLSKLVSSVEMTGVGAAQAKDWKYEFGQAQFRKSGFFWQAFLNRSNAGDTYLLRTGAPIVDESNVFVTQGQYAFNPLDRLELVGGVDFIRTEPKTLGTITGANEDMDKTREIGGFAHATLSVTDQLDLIGALRVDDHEHLEDPVWSPRLGLVFEPIEGHAFRGAFNRAFSTPSTNNLFLDLIVGQVPLAPLPFDYGIRTTGVPSTGYTWTNQCLGGANNYCMYSPFLEGTQLPATGTVFWDDIAIPAMILNPNVQAALTAAGWTPQQFAAAVAGPTPADIESVLLRFNQEDPVNNPFLPDPGVTPVARILPNITTTYEVGYQGTIQDKVRISAGVYRSEIRDFVGPLRVETPSVFLDGPSAGSFIATRLIMNGMDPADAAAVAGAGAPSAASIPYGTVAPDQRSDSDLVLTYRNFGDVELWGADLGVEVYATQDLTLTGTYSWVNKECFDFNDDGSCSSAADIALNAPTNKGSLGFRYDDAETGLGFGARLRYTDAFPMNSGVYIGTVEDYAVFDANVAYRVPGYEGFIVSATVNNIFDEVHREFIGAPEIGRVALVQLQYAIGN